MAIPYRGFENTIQTLSQGSRNSIKFQKKADPIYFAAEASNHAT